MIKQVDATCNRVIDVDCFQTGRLLLQTHMHPYRRTNFALSWRLYVSLKLRLRQFASWCVVGKTDGYGL